MTTNNVQTSYDAAPGVAYAGQLVDTMPHDVASGLAGSDVVAGVVLLRNDGGLGVVQPSIPDPSATAILATGGASAAAPHTYSGTALNGTVGGGEMVVPRNVTLTLSNSTDWDTTNATVNGLNADGDAVSEILAIPNNGNTTLNGSVLFSKVTSIVVDAQSGTGGTFTAGFGSLVGEITRHVTGASLYDSSKAPGVFAAGTTVPVLRKGRVYLQSEAGRPDDPVWVRVSASGSQVLGAVRSSADGNTCARLRGAIFRSTTSNGLAVVEFNLPR